MSRERLRKALSARSEGDPAIVPLVESHAARLEQLPPARWLCEAEAHAKMLRSAQGLYGYDAVTVGGAGLLAADACRLAAAQGLGAVAARAAAPARSPLGALPDPETVAASFAVALARDVIKRLRPVLADRAAIVLVLADPTRLAADLGRPDEAGWTGEVAAALLRALGPEEPDAIFLLGDEDPIDPTLESLADFYGVPIVPIGQGSPRGVVAQSSAELLSDALPPPGWLFATRDEIAPEAAPQALRAAIDRLRRRG